MKIIDLHQDLLFHIRFGEQLGQSKQTDFAMLENSAVDVVVATAFPYPENNNQLDPSVPKLITEELEQYNQHCLESTQWSVVENVDDFSKLGKKILLHIEGLNLFTGTHSDWKLLDDWYRLGVRSIGTHWNVNNALGGGTLDPDAPLTDLGREVIHWLEEKKIVLDFAHMGRETFMAAAKVVSRPLYVSHGNVDTLCPDVRNYTDEQLKLIATTNGVIGVFFAGSFVAGRERKSAVADVVGHMTYIKNLIGIEHIAIGSDFGGVLANSVEQLSSVADFDNLLTALLEAGFSTNEVEALAYDNARRVLEAQLS